MHLHSVVCQYHRFFFWNDGTDIQHYANALYYFNFYTFLFSYGCYMPHQSNLPRFNKHRNCNLELLLNFMSCNFFPIFFLLLRAKCTKSEVKEKVINKINYFLRNLSAPVWILRYRMVLFWGNDADCKKFHGCKHCPLHKNNQTTLCAFHCTNNHKNTWHFLYSLDVITNTFSKMASPSC